ncbi:toprim domain-containing protein [Photobacterium sp. GB-72]|uniref:DUF7146 domain-containing protein n=1 Tax=Photobacterium sp. GB-72 TaxID=2022105 RepID=UPI000D174089|nr:toprim domain-containing protein [Photobacterium sp. GB-72]PSV26262.1 hypothetical protein C9J40_21510 [Photobacterium sp. GB-72]
MYDQNQPPLWKRVKELCDSQNLWLNVFDELVGGDLTNLTKEFNPQRHAATKCACPVHGGKTGKAYGLLKHSAQSGASVCNSCGVFKNGFETIMAWTRWEFKDAVRYIAATKTVGLIESNSNYRGPTKPKPQWEAPKVDQEAENRKHERNERFFNEAYSIESEKGQLVYAYFGNRGINLDDIAKPNVKRFFGDVRVHLAMPYWAYVWDHDTGKLTEKPVKIAETPALLSWIRNPQGKRCNLHVTYLTEDGFKATDYLWQRWCEVSEINPDDVPESFRKKYGPDAKKVRTAIAGKEISGGALQLGLPTKIMAVSEGLENIACFMSDFDNEKIAAWGLLNATMMGKWVPPHQGNRSVVEHVLILADHDKAGIENAVKLREQLARYGVKGHIITPLMLFGEGHEAGFNAKTDWNDVYQHYGKGCLTELFDEDFFADMYKMDDPIGIPLPIFEEE